MTSSSPHVAKLSAQARCPCCGADRYRAVELVKDLHFEVLFQCGAGFLALVGAGASIVSYAACRNVTAVAAEMLNREIEESEMAWKDLGDDDT